MDYEIVRLDKCTVAGIAAKTSNTAKDMTEVIGGLWSRFMGGGVCNAVQACDPRPLGIYTDYESDASGSYTVMTACRTTADKAADGLIVREIPAGRYAKFVVKGMAGVGRLWAEIWKMNLPRAYTVDFEEYQGSGQDDEIHVYIALKPVQSHCGILCDECAYKKETGCKGCTFIDKPFWGEKCPVMDCCRNKRSEHCGECEQFPCSLLHSFAYDKEQGDDGKRIEQCKAWKDKK